MLTAAAECYRAGGLVCVRGDVWIPNGADAKPFLAEETIRPMPWSARTPTIFALLSRGMFWSTAYAPEGYVTSVAVSGAYQAYLVNRKKA